MYLSKKAEEIINKGEQVCSFFTLLGKSLYIRGNT